MINTSRKFTRKWLFWGLFAVLLLTLFLRYALMIYFSSLIFVALLVLIALIGDMDEILAVCICCIPLSMVIPYYFVITFCMVVCFFKYWKSIRLDFSFVPVLLIVIWELCHCFSGNLTLKEILAMMVPYVFFVWIVSVSHIRSINYALITRVFALLTLFMCAVLLWRLFVLSNYNLDVLFFNMQRLGLNEEDINELVINPNSIGILCVISASGLSQLYMYREKKISDIVLMVAILVLGSLTLSRTFLACLVIMGVYYFIVSKGAKNKIKFFVSAVVIVLICFGLLQVLFPSVLESFATRFQVEDISNGRSNLFNQYNEYLRSSSKALFWGVGVTRFSEKVIFQYAISFNVPHNGIQEILVAWGIPGVLLFVALIFVLIRGSKRVNSHGMSINYLPLLIIFAKAMVGQLITSSYTLLALSFAYLSLCQDFTGTQELNKTHTDELNEMSL